VSEKEPATANREPLDDTESTESAPVPPKRIRVEETPELEPVARNPSVEPADAIVLDPNLIDVSKEPASAQTPSEFTATEVPLSVPEDPARITQLGAPL
jgi:hypothetical protein